MYFQGISVIMVQKLLIIDEKYAEEYCKARPHKIYLVRYEEDELDKAIPKSSSFSGWLHYVDKHHRRLSWEYWRKWHFLMVLNQCIPAKWACWTDQNWFNLTRKKNFSSTYYSRCPLQRYYLKPSDLRVHLRFQVASTTQVLQ